MIRTVVGLMSGTSADGIDAALCRIEGIGSLELIAFRSSPYEPALRERLIRAAEGDAGPGQLARLSVELGNVLADAVQRLLEDEPAVSVDAVASHGHTFWHEPGRASLQLGDPAVIAERCGVPVVSDFRSRDIAAGGQGAPLVPAADLQLFRGNGNRVLLNIGGMANLTWLPAASSGSGEVVAFDTGPGVAVMDAAYAAVGAGGLFDRDGVLAASGEPLEEVVREVLRHPYFSQSPPKSTGRETFGSSFANRLVSECQRKGGGPGDVLATAVALTADSISWQLSRFVPSRPDDVVVSGGGARHPPLMTRLREKLSPARVVAFDELYFDGDAKEAVAFAYLGWLCLEGEPGNLPAATGARGPRILGSITPA